MVRYAQLNRAGDRVENVIVLPRSGVTEWEGHDLLNVEGLRVGPGWLYDGQDFTEPQRTRPDQEQRDAYARLRAATTVAQVRSELLVLFKDFDE